MAGVLGLTPLTTPASSHPPPPGPSPQKEADPLLALAGGQYVAEAEEKLQRARLLVENVRKEKVDLSNQLEEERRYALPPPWSWEDVSSEPP